MFKVSEAIFIKDPDFREVQSIKKNIFLRTQIVETVKVGEKIFSQQPRL